MRYEPALRRLQVEDKKTGDIVPFRPNLEQKEFIRAVEEQESEGKPIRIIILKARQMGLSTATEGVIFVRSQVIPNTRSLIMAHEIESSEHILQMTKLFWESSPWSKIYTPKWNSRKEMAWNEHRSTIKIATAGNKNPGRGKTLRALHVSELAFYENASKTMLALNQAVPNSPNSMVVLESTANGIGNYYHERWQEAWDEQDSDYFPLFFPWQDFPEYCLPGPYPQLANHQLDAEEKHLKAMGLSDGRLYWRRWAIRNLCENDIVQFHQEYPSAPDEAFASTGTNVFSQGKLKNAYEPSMYMQGDLHRDGPNYIQFKDDPEGELKIFKRPSADRDAGQYFVGEDSTYTTTHDFCCIQVINRRTYEQVAVWRGRRDPYTIAEEVVKLARYYNDAYVSVESTGPGQGTIGSLIEMGYPFLWRNTYADKLPGQPTNMLGWHTGEKTKEWLIAWMKKLLVDGKVTIHDKTTFHEMTNWIRLPGGKYGPAQGEGKGHDDTIMALMIACLCSAEGDPMMPYGLTLEEKLFPEKFQQQMTPTWNEQLMESVA